MDFRDPNRFVPFARSPFDDSDVKAACDAAGGAWLVASICALFAWAQSVCVAHERGYRAGNEDGYREGYDDGACESAVVVGAFEPGGVCEGGGGI